jgi:DNA-binding NtrC family response regulator
MAGSNGLDLHQLLLSKGNAKSIVFLRGYGDIPMTVQAMKADRRFPHNHRPFAQPSARRSWDSARVYLLTRFPSLRMHPS